MKLNIIKVLYDLFMIWKVTMFKHTTLIVIATFHLSLTSLVGADELSTQFVGCYSSSQARSDDSAHHVDPLAWKMCVRLCLHMNVKYAGLESTASTCYCGNGLAQQTENVAAFQCDEVCYGDRRKTCGGDKLMSLYEIQSKASLKFMVSSDNGIAYFEDKVLSPNFVSLPWATAIKFVYNYARNEVYLVAKEKIWSSQYKSVLMEYQPVVPLMDVGASPSSIALDWVHNKLYWTLPHKLVQANVDGSSRREIAYLSGSATDLSINPFERKMLFIQKGKIHLFDLKTSKLVEENLLKWHRMEEVTCLTVEPQRGEVYAVGRLGDQGHLVSTDTLGNNLRVLQRRPGLATASSLSVLGDQVFWVESGPRGSRRELYSCRLPSSSAGLCEPTRLANLPMIIQDIKVYSDQVQISSRKYFCEKKGCSHSCTLESTDSVKCGCPEHMDLAADLRTCQEPEKHFQEDTSDEIDKSLDVGIDKYFHDSKETRKKSKLKQSRQRIPLNDYMYD